MIACCGGFSFALGGCISALLSASVLQQSVVSADVEDTGDTTKSVQHAPAVHTRPNVQQKCSFCGQPRKGHTCLFVEGTIKWRDLCATVCQGGSRNGCARCRSSVTKRARGKEDAAGGAGGGVSISGGGSAHSAAVAATPKKKAMQGFLERQQASAPLEQARFKTQLFDRLKELGPDVVQNTRQLTRALYAFDEEFLEANMDEHGWANPLVWGPWERRRGVRRLGLEAWGKTATG